MNRPIFISLILLVPLVLFQGCSKIDAGDSDSQDPKLSQSLIVDPDDPGGEPGEDLDNSGGEPGEDPDNSGGEPGEGSNDDEPGTEDPEGEEDNEEPGSGDTGGDDSNNSADWVRCIEEGAKLSGTQPLNDGVSLENLRGLLRFLAHHVLRYSHNYGNSVVVGQGEGSSIDLVEDAKGKLMICGMNVDQMIDVSGNIKVVGGSVEFMEHIQGNITVDGSVGTLSNIRGLVRITGDVRSIDGVDVARGKVHVKGNILGNVNSMHGLLIVDGQILGDITNSRGKIQVGH